MTQQKADAMSYPVRIVGPRLARPRCLPVKPDAIDVAILAVEGWVITAENAMRRAHGYPPKAVEKRA